MSKKNCIFAVGKSCTICSLSTPPGQECSKGTLVVAMRYEELTLFLYKDGMFSVVSDE